jgi:acyl-CoA synthetase (AMP-forming)/AMP-acid ligase II
MNVAQLFAKAAGSYSDRTAVVHHGEHFTFAECWSRGLRMAAWLESAGFRPGDRLATLEFNNIGSVDLFLGAAIAGVVRVALTPGVSSAAVHHVVSTTGCRGVVHDVAIPVPAAVLAALDAPGFVLTRGTEYERELSGYSPTGPTGRTTSDDAPFVIRTTGGTTGFPKPIVYSHRAWLAACRDWFFPLPAVEIADRSLNISPLPHGGAYFFTTVWLAGGTNVLAGPSDLPFIGQLMRSEAIGYAFMVPPVLEMLLAQLDAPLPALKAIAIAGGRAPAPVLSRALDLLGQRIWQMYGLTEAVPIACMTPEDLHAAIQSDHPRRHSVGRIMPFAESRIARPDIDLGTTAGGLTVGEVVVRCDSSSARAAADRPEGTVDDGWVSTGDAGAIGEDGYLFLAGRLQDAVRTRLGVIWPARLEDAILDVAGIRSAAVVARPESQAGEHIPAAVCVVDVMSEQALAAVREACSVATGGWWEALNATVLIRAEGLPLTPAGKVDRRRIAAELS